jgi:fructose-1,6-bisphosphatase/inositol monophosphatase family enzyme
MTPYAPELRFARAFAAEAAAVVRRIRAGGFDVATKADRTLVTTADHEVNRQFIEQVVARFPDDGVLGEEASRLTGGPRTWVIDPIDGTQQFVLGIPVFMVSVALVVDGRPVIGVAANPSTGETYWAEAGAGAYRDGIRLRVSRRDGTTVPVIVSGGGAHPVSPDGLDADALLRVHTAPAVSSTAQRYPWPTVFSGCKVAEGSWDADLFGHATAHDVAAVCVLVREAGGTVTDRSGADQRYDRRVDGCILSNGLVHEHLVRHWRPARPVVTGVSAG